MFFPCLVVLHFLLYSYLLERFHAHRLPFGIHRPLFFSQSQTKVGIT
jgi:hypothetical protein